ncbi:bifunctional phosphopantothenoylcysteine decarboxylase/phosphopantothenate synthase [Neolewinella antarctica]|uniref:Coenzyme A biosynthesis bifunctional protein CoaBC n=1 Tax=Neolewinella antarctica TaxID=442734 RepID=A0ABX0XBE7_9BACT|nr:bifunctional phosphopantothenoylcysteine decarboxylase/phosphopantothenate synthase [Neolewinella antarctica]NJC26269.1 phosphopantothenoylcysteine decarboxylase/phosphopantothenate--cysteine ligase [Neolewinella antarctica]
MSIKGKKIILGVSGSIAAYKAALLVRGLIKGGAEVKVLMTRAAADFISPLTLATLSKNEVTTSVHNGESWNNHVELGLWADAMIIAPATATTLGKMATAICDNAIVAVYLSARCPIFFAPAMDLDMWAHPATQRNVALLKTYGNHLIDVGDGELASGLSGAGRLAEPENIITILDGYFSGRQQNNVKPKLALPSETEGAVAGVKDIRREQDLLGKRILVTAGPTHEDLDPVRYLGNRSTGRMGIAIAEAAAARGARVDLILGPTNLSTTAEGVQVLAVRTAREMHAASVALWPKANAAILAAAVADYRPKNVAKQKIKKKEGALSVELVRNPDIAAELGQDKKSHQRLVGFALETNDELVNARRKLVSKNLDFIVLNSPSDEGTGFGHTTNRVQFVDATSVKPFDLKEKTAVADDILNELVTRF